MLKPLKLLWDQEAQIFTKKISLSSLRARISYEFEVVSKSALKLLDWLAIFHCSIITFLISDKCLEHAQKYKHQPQLNGNHHCILTKRKFCLGQQSATLLKIPPPITASPDNPKDDPSPINSKHHEVKNWNIFFQTAILPLAIAALSYSCYKWWVSSIQYVSFPNWWSWGNKWSSCHFPHGRHELD